ncbi:hypothetical protein [Flavobacterium sp. J27]|nr:hypothetical protein [Flavobacterium sp. J27]
MRILIALLIGYYYSRKYGVQAVKTIQKYYQEKENQEPRKKH